jgi:uncharacterized protein (TIGR02757 family)
MDRARLDSLYALYNRRCYVHPDPLECLYDFPDVRDREIVGLIASVLAYGRVVQIIRSVRTAMGALRNHPRAFLEDERPVTVRKALASFKHRFTTGAELAELLLAVQRQVREFGSLEQCFAAGWRPDHESIIPALAAFSKRLTVSGSAILPTPENGSACKRLNLYLRWMVRADDVDPGGWTRIPKAQLLFPLDTHMARISRDFGLTTRASVNLVMTQEVTRCFAAICPEDPVKYDFALTRFGIRDDLDRALLHGNAP